MIRLVVFDMAGTVINENNVVYKTLQKAANLGGIPVDLQQVLAVGAGKEKSNALHDLAATYAPSVSKSEIGKMYDNFLVLLEEAYQTLGVTAMPGAVQIFEELKRRGIQITLNTGYNKATAEHLLSKLGWRAGVEIDMLVTASDVAGSRPHPDMIFYAMKSLGVDNPAWVMKVGDSQIDIEEGKNAGCGITVGITTGAHTREQLMAAQPDYIVAHLSEILDLL